MRKVPAKNIQWLEKELPILESEGVVSTEIATGIKSYYAEKTASGLHWAIIVFAVLGSLLIGSGIILLFAHNWDELGRPVRAILSFCPLIIGAVVSVIALCKNGGVALRESAGIFHSLTVGSSIALIGQTYHLPSNTPGFMLSWSLLILPLVFLLRSTGTLLIYLALICGWSGVAQYEYGHAAGFWLLMLPAVVRLIMMIRENRYAPDSQLSLIGVLLALTISTGMTFERTIPGLWIIAYSALLSGAGLLGIHLYSEERSNLPKVFGMIGIALLSYLFTWTFFWEEVGWDFERSGWHHRSWGIWMDGGVTLLFLAGWAVAAIKSFRKQSIETITLATFPIMGIIGFLIASAGRTYDLNAVIFNGFMLFFGIMYIVIGCRNTRLRQLNGGMAVLSLLFVTRFFDAEFGFFARGIVFILLGTSFLTVNLIMARRKKQLEVVS